MSSVTADKTQRTLMEAVRALPSESQRAILSYALFLQSQEKMRRAETDEAAWDHHFGQPEKLARFAQWARQSLDQHPAEPLDESRL